MNKKIIAVSLVILIITVMFAACGKDKGYKLDVDNDGFTHAYATDAEGNTVLDEEGSIIVYQTEKNGEIATDENGNKKENRVEMPEKIVKSDLFENKAFKVTIPEGWIKGEGGLVQYSKKGNNNCKINIVNCGSIKDKVSDKDDAETKFNKAMDDIVKDANKTKDAIIKEYPDTTYSYKTVKISNLDMLSLNFAIIDKNGKVIHGAQEYYFIIGEDLYAIKYYNYQGDGYDKDYDFGSFIEQNLKLK